MLDESVTQILFLQHNFKHMSRKEFPQAQSTAPTSISSSPDD